jgi:hypothetical protein
MLHNLHKLAVMVLATEHIKSTIFEPSPSKAIELAPESVGILFFVETHGTIH